MRALSLEYHDVVAGRGADATGFPGAGPGSYKLSLDVFQHHLDRIAREASVQPGRAIDWLQHPDGTRPLFVTFDDGGVSAHGCIADALERRGWRGHFFVTAGRIGHPTFVSSMQIRELQARGHVIGTHSMSHPARMGACPAEQIRDEWRRSSAIIADILGEPVLTASVPGGFYTPVVGEAAAEAGLKVLFTSFPTTKVRSVDGCLVLGRYTLRRWSAPGTAGALAAGRWRPRVAQWTLYTGLHAVRTVAGDHYTRLRQRFWARAEGSL